MARTAARRGAPKREPVRLSGMAEEEQAFLHDEIVEGVDARKVKRLMERGMLSPKQVFRVIPERTFNRRLAGAEPLKVAEADAIGRLVRVTQTANRIFRDAEFARKWLSLPNPALKDRVPMDLAETDAGAREVEIILGRIAHGIYS